MKRTLIPRCMYVQINKDENSVEEIQSKAEPRNTKIAIMPYAYSVNPVDRSFFLFSFTLFKEFHSVITRIVIDWRKVKVLWHFYRE